MPWPWRLVVFDCDGTLVDSQHAIVATMAEAFRVSGYTLPTADAVRGIVGLNLEVAIGRLLQGMQIGPADRNGSGRARQIAEAYREAYLRVRDDPRHSEPLFPGCTETLIALEERGALLGIATGKGRRGLASTLGVHGILDRFVTLQTADDGPGKPHPGMLERAMAETGSEPHQTVLIGDTVFDMEMARNAGVAALGVSWGYHRAEDLAATGALQVIDSFGDLVPTLHEMGDKQA